MFSKTLLAGVVLFTALGFASCKKDYNCVCRYETILGVDEVDVEEIEGVKRETAQDVCAEREDELRILYPDAVCDLE